jgi:hypothetical protein
MPAPIDQAPPESTRTDDDFAASVVVLSDFASGTEQGWNDLRGSLAALARQDTDEKVEYLLVESEEYREEVPGDLQSILPGLRIVFTPGRNSYEIRNDGVRAASCEIVATIDGDCAADPDFVRLMIDSLRAHPNAAAVSGRTVYSGGGFYPRAAALLERSFVEEGRRGPMRHITNNGSGFRRSVYLHHPLRTDVGVFASQLQSEAMLRAGYELLFEPRMRVTHAFYRSFDRDHRLGIGYGAIRIRLEDGGLPYASLARMGCLSVPVFFFGRLAKGWVQAIRNRRAYDVRWYELPGVLLLAVLGCVTEIPGLWRAATGLPPPATHFR